MMFADLVGSTTLSARMDPEDLREVISGYQKCVAQTVQRFGGFEPASIFTGDLPPGSRPKSCVGPGPKTCQSSSRIDLIW